MRDLGSAFDALEGDPLIAAIEAMFSKSDAADDYVDDALDDAALRELPAPAELIPGWVPEVGVMGLWAPPGHMKTFVAVGMAEAVRSGRRWQNRHHKVRRQGGVLFFEGEVVTQLPDRQDAVNTRWPSKRRRSPQWTIPRTPDLTSVAGVAAVVRTAEAFREKLRAEDDDLVLIVFDPLPEFMTGEENGDGLVRATRALCWLAEYLQVAIVVGHQSNAAGERARGHDVFRQKVFVLAHVERPEPDLVALVQDKNKFRPELALTLAVTEVSLPPIDGEARSSVVLAYERGGAHDLLAHEYLSDKADRVASAKRKRVSPPKRRPGAEDVIVQAFARKANEHGESIFDSGRKLWEAAKQIAEENGGTLPYRTFKSAAAALVEAGVIELGEKGSRDSQEHRYVPPAD